MVMLSCSALSFVQMKRFWKTCTILPAESVLKCEGLEWNEKLKRWKIHVRFDASHFFVGLYDDKMLALDDADKIVDHFKSVSFNESAGMAQFKTLDNSTSQLVQTIVNSLADPVAVKEASSLQEKVHFFSFNKIPRVKRADKKVWHYRMHVHSNNHRFFFEPYDTLTDAINHCEVLRQGLVEDELRVDAILGETSPLTDDAKKRSMKKYFSDKLGRPLKTGKLPLTTPTTGPGPPRQEFDADAQQLHTLSPIMQFIKIDL